LPVRDRREAKPIIRLAIKRGREFAWLATRKHEAKPMIRLASTRGRELSWLATRPQAPLDGGVQIREFDAGGGWANGFPSCAAWLTWRIGLAPGAAREHVRVARALSLSEITGLPKYPERTSEC
jgi:hypothetical protein